MWRLKSTSDSYPHSSDPLVHEPLDVISISVSRRMPNVRIDSMLGMRPGANVSIKSLGPSSPAEATGRNRLPWNIT
jgi:hypothetical protein